MNSNTAYSTIYTCALPRLQRPNAGLCHLFKKPLSHIPLHCNSRRFFHKLYHLTIWLLFLPTDLRADLEVVLEGAFWVQIHADRSKLVQLLLRPASSQGQFRPRHTVGAWLFCAPPFFFSLQSVSVFHVFRWRCWILELREDSIRVSPTPTLRWETPQQKHKAKHCQLQSFYNLLWYYDTRYTNLFQFYKNISL